MIHDHVGRVSAHERVVLHAVHVAQPRTDEADDHVVRVARIKRVARQADAVAGRGLAGDGEVALGDAQGGVEVDRSGDGEDDGARDGDVAIGHALAQRARAGIVEVGDNVNVAAASAAGKAAKALRPWEGDRLGASDGGREAEAQKQSER